MRLADRWRAIGSVELHKLALETEQFTHLFGEEADRVVGRSARSVEDVEQLGRQAFMQARAAGWADVNPIALQAIGRRAIAFIHGRADAAAFEALGKRQSANAAADDENMKRLGHKKLLSRMHGVDAARRCVGRAVLAELSLVA